MTARTKGTPPARRARPGGGRDKLKFHNQATPDRQATHRQHRTNTNHKQAQTSNPNNPRPISPNPRVPPRPPPHGSTIADGTPSSSATSRARRPSARSRASGGGTRISTAARCTSTSASGSTRVRSASSTTQPRCPGTRTSFRARRRATAAHRPSDSGANSCDGVTPNVWWCVGGH